jgi:hypothetical protein
MTDSQPISDFLSHTHLGPQQFFKSLSLWPLRLGADAPTSRVPYGPLADAISGRRIEVDEVDAGGSVPHVRVRNNGDQAVLFLFGEEIRGAKQNRVANASFLVPAHSDLVLDVSCVEAGRWQRHGRQRFSSSKEILSSALRRKMSRTVGASRLRGGSFHANQADVWREIGQRVEFSGVGSPTSAYADYVGSRDSDLREIERAFRCVEGQVGFVACIGGRVAGLELIGRPDVFAASFRALLRSYAVDAIDAAVVQDPTASTAEKTQDGVDSPEAFLEAISAEPCRRSPSLGAGLDLRLSGSRAEGCALVDGAVVHLTAFPAPAA